MPSPLFNLPNTSNRAKPFSTTSTGQQPGKIIQGIPVGGDQGIAFFPQGEAFFPTTMDVYTGNGAVPPTGTKRYSALSVYMTGVWGEGHRTKVATKDAYTHLILADPTLTLYDSYNELGRTQIADTLSLPAGQTNNNWFVVFSFLTVVPEFGRRLVIAADRFGTPASWPNLL